MKTQRRQDQRGSVLVEMAFGLLVLVPVLLGVIQFGMVSFYFSELQNAVRTGARFASYRVYDSRNDNPSDNFVTAVRNVTVYGSPDGGTKPVVSGLTPANVDVQVIFERAVPDRIRISVKDFQINLLVAKYRLQKPSAEYPYVGRFAPPD